MDRVIGDIYFEATGNVSALVNSLEKFISHKQKPCLFTNSELPENALIVASIPTPVEVSTAHGWRIMPGPCLATKSEANIIYTLIHNKSVITGSVSES